LRGGKAGLCNLSNTEVSQLHAAARRQENVGGFQIAVDDAALVQRRRAHQRLDEEAPDEVLVHELLARNVALDLCPNVAEAREFSDNVQLVAVEEGVIVANAVRVLDRRQQPHFIQRIVPLALVHCLDFKLLQRVFLPVGDSDGAVNFAERPFSNRFEGLEALQSLLRSHKILRYLEGDRYRVQERIFSCPTPDASFTPAQAAASKPPPPPHYNPSLLLTSTNAHSSSIAFCRWRRRKLTRHFFLNCNSVGFHPNVLGVRCYRVFPLAGGEGERGGC